MIYTNQSNVKIRLTGLGNISDAVSQKIKYKDPSGTESEWDATIEDDSSGIIYYDLLPNEYLKEGSYILWSKIVDSEGRTSIGSPSTLRVYKEGSIAV